MRDVTLRNAKATLRGFFAGQDSAYLTRVVDECRAGTFTYVNSCHCIRGLADGGYHANNMRPFVDAEFALLELCTVAIKNWDGDSIGPFSRKRTLPIVLAEIRRRQQYAQVEVEHEEFVQ